MEMPGDKELAELIGCVCPQMRSCEHEWAGPEARWELGESATCTKCGCLALEISEMEFDAAA